jgi:hypothetical protein
MTAGTARSAGKGGRGVSETRCSHVVLVQVGGQHQTAFIQWSKLPTLHDG